MKDRFPRTAGEFAEHNRQVLLRCESCGHRWALEPQLVIFTFGEDFDLYDGFQEVRSRLACEQCGTERPDVLFRNLEDKYFEPVGYWQALTNDLEFRAFVRARDGDAPRRRGLGRIRRFGRR